MKNQSLLLFIIACYAFVFQACLGGSGDVSKKLEGTWLSSHEPFGYVFKADGKYDIIDIEPEGIRESGTWKVQGDKLVMTNASGTANEPQKINFVDGLLYLGEIPEFDANCAECEYKSAAEYIKEMGLKKK